MSNERHDPTFLVGPPYGTWCRCTCGWESTYGNRMHAQLAFGRHVLATLPTMRPAND